MVADQPPAPGGVRLRLAEEAEEVAACIAEGGRDVTEHGQVELAKHVLVGHHLDHSSVGRNRHRLSNQPVRQCLLAAVELSQRETVPAGLGQEVPVCPARVRVRQQHPSALIGGQSIEQTHCAESDCGCVERAARSRPVRVGQFTAWLRMLRRRHERTSRFLLVARVCAGDWSAWRRHDTNKGMSVCSPAANT